MVIFVFINLFEATTLHYTYILIFLYSASILICINHNENLFCTLFLLANSNSAGMRLENLHFP